MPVALVAAVLCATSKRSPVLAQWLDEAESRGADVAYVRDWLQAGP
jgi:hypothetical protein